MSKHSIDSTDAQFLARKQRWWDAYQVGGSVSLPLVMVDSGNQFSNGVQTIDVYRNMSTLCCCVLPRPRLRPSGGASAIVSDFPWR